MPRPAISRDRSMLPRAIRLLLPALAAMILFSSPDVSAQYEGRTYAITDARLVTLTGQVIENGTIVLRGGLIEALGADVLPPADAVLIDGDGMTVYPGFIDAYSQAGLALPDRDDREHAGNIANQLATEYFDPASTDLAAYRKQGLTSALIARSDGVFGGQAVLMNLMGDDIPSMTVKAPVVQVMGYQGQSGYPGTLMAVVAWQRQTLIDAAYHELLQTRYRDDPRSMARPPAELDLEALIPVAKGEATVMGIVQIENDFKRLRKLATEYNLRYWIAGAAEAFRVPDLIREAGVPVLVSLDFPSINEVTGYQFDRAYRNLTEEEKKELDSRDEAAVQSNPAAVFRTGVPFALATGGMQNIGDFLKNLRLSVEAGLPAEEALKALTFNPATIFGVADVMGTLEPGKIANLTVTSGDIFTDEEAFVAHVFVDGRKETFEKPKPPSLGGGGGSAGGSWTVTVSLGGEGAEGSLNLTQEGETVTGELSVEGQTTELEGTYKEGQLELKGSIPEMGAITLTATIEGDEMKGSLGLGPMGTANFTGKRNPGSSTGERRVGR
ncbi:MAG: amidohydrolase family protein [Gemmatimonadota bacterium]